MIGVDQGTDLFLTLRIRFLNKVHGKKIRPLFFLSLCQNFLQDHFHVAAALEFIHTYSLIQDDLPSMDDDDFRRKKPSLHKKFPEAVAILTSDALMTEAFLLLSKCPSFPYETKLKLIQLFSEYSGASALIQGQYLDLFFTQKLSFAKLNEIFGKKTGSLFILSFLAAAVIENYPLALFKKLGEKVGLLFQYFDDFYDDEKNLPKVHAKSLLSQKEIMNIMEKLTEEIWQIFKKLPKETLLFQEIVHTLFLRKIPKGCVCKEK